MLYAGGLGDSAVADRGEFQWKLNQFSCMTSAGGAGDGAVADK